MTAVLIGPGGRVEVDNDIGNPLPVTGVVTLGGAVDLTDEPAREVGVVSLTPASLAALESITAAVTGTVALDAPTLAALESITAVGPLTDTQLRATAVLVSGFPADYPDAATLAKVEAVRALLAGTIQVAGPLTDSQLRATAPAVKDDYQTGECLAEQTGAGASLTFTFANPMGLILVEAIGTGTQVARVDPFGGTPSATLGIHADDGIPTYIPVTATVVKVFAPASMIVSVNGFRRT